MLLGSGGFHTTPNRLNREYSVIVDKGAMSEFPSFNPQSSFPSLKSKPHTKIITLYYIRTVSFLKLYDIISAVI